MRDCINCEDTAINCTETTTVTNTPGQNRNEDRTGSASPSEDSRETQYAGDAGDAGGQALSRQTEDAPRDSLPLNAQRSTLNDAPWYAEGLRFECTQCGDCCTGAPGAVWVTDEELTAIAAELGKPLGEVRLLYTKLMGGRWSLRDYPNGDCVFLDPQTRRCRVYAARPMQCRTWPFWPSNIETTDSWKRTCDRCPGAGTGALHSLEVIQLQADACNI